MELAQVTISNVYKSKPMSGSYGEYFIYNFTLEGDERKFSCIPSKVVDMPKEGGEVPFMEFTHSQNQGKDGKTYDNYRVTSLIVKGGVTGGASNSQPPTSPGRSTNVEEAILLGLSRNCLARIALGFIQAGATPEQAAKEAKPWIDFILEGANIMVARSKGDKGAEPPLRDNAEKEMETGSDIPF